MALTMEWSASSFGDFGSGESTARLKKDNRLGVLTINNEHGTVEVVRLTAAELRELATLANALANEIGA